LLTVGHIMRHAQEIASEDGLDDLVRYACSWKHRKGRWLLRLDIAPEGQEAAGEESGMPKKAGEHENVMLTVNRRKMAGECQGECATLQKVCKMVLKNKDEELVSMITDKKDYESIRDMMCSRTCDRRKELAALPRWTDEVFVKANEEALAMEDMMSHMAGQGGGKRAPKVLSREDIAKLPLAERKRIAAEEAGERERREAKKNPPKDPEPKKDPAKDSTPKQEL